jgi:hypothetical protein
MAWAGLGWVGLGSNWLAMAGRDSSLTFGWLLRVSESPCQSTNGAIRAAVPNAI